MLYTHSDYRIAKSRMAEIERKVQLARLASESKGQSNYAFPGVRQRLARLLRSPATRAPQTC